MKTTHPWFSFVSLPSPVDFHMCTCALAIERCYSSPNSPALRILVLRGRLAHDRGMTACSRYISAEAQDCGPEIGY